MELTRLLLRPLSDERLVEQLRRGNKAAFEALFNRYHRGILSFCQNMLGSREDAEEAVQQTFLAAYKSLVEIDNPGSPQGRLYTIACNLCLTMLRAGREEPSEGIAESYYTGLADGDIAYIAVRRPHGTVRSEEEPWGLRDYDRETGALVGLEVWSASRVLSSDVLEALPRLEGRSDTVITREDLAKPQPA